MLRSRLPLNQFIGPGPGNQTPSAAGPQAAAYPAMQRQFPRQTMRPQHPGTMQQNQVYFFLLLFYAANFFFFRHYFNNNMVICKLTWANSMVITLVILQT